MILNDHIVKNHRGKFSLFGFLIIATIVQTHCIYAQPSPLLKLPAHTHVAKVSWRDSIYRFPDFQFGRITWATGFAPVDTFRLNYNLYFAQLDLINAKGDTVQVKPSRELKLVQIGGNIFYHDDRRGYIEVLYQAPISLGVLTILSTVKMVYASGSFEGTSSGMDTRGIPSVYDRYYKRATTYFFIDGNNKLHKAIRPSVLKLYANHKKAINAYLDENKIDFTRERDLFQLLNFCNRL